MSASAVLSPTNHAAPAAWPAPLSQTRAIARLSGVTRRYGQITALDNFSLTLNAGEVVALLGPNGAGKTTAVRLLLGLISPHAGSVRVLGRDPRDSDARTRIGAMLQVSRVPEMLRVREHIDLFRTYYPAPLPTADIIRIAKLEGIENQMFGKLSGGQKQRALFGLALCGNPDLIFLDEPTVGMDIESRRALWDQVRALSAAGKTILLTTHYLEEADMLAHRVVVINKGKLVCEGTPAEIKHRVSGRRIRCITQLDPAFLRALPTVSSVEQDREAVIIVAERPEPVVRIMLERDENLHGLEIAAAALEDAFLALTSENGGRGEKEIAH
jgi:ABC-2 type transport system ATP-binding protein